MRTVGELLGVLLVLNGVGGLLHEWIGWFRLWTLVRRLEFLDGYEVVANIGLLLIGVVLLFALDQLGSPEQRT